MTDTLAQVKKVLTDLLSVADMVPFTDHFLQELERASSALAAIDAALEGGAVPKVKALKWKRRKHGHPGDIFVNTIVGEYAIGDIHGRVTALLRTIKGSDVDDVTVWEGFDFWHAKAAAQADYERRILSALDLPSPPTGA
jgi:hypothetical protein